jgi:hypothetical protein
MLFALFALFAVASAQTQADCDGFCTNYTATCMPLATANDIYNNTQACVDECMRFPVDANCMEGDINDPTNCGSGNSWGCRRYHLNVAMTAGMAASHCPHTTPLSSPSTSITASDALTGTLCKTTVTSLPNVMQNGLVADFCNQVTSACSAWMNTLDMAKCVSYYSFISGATDVGNYPDGSNRKFPLAPIVGSGLPCRRYHAQVARSSLDNADAHCKHALFGADACGTPCEQLCSMGPAICPGSFDAACMSDCADTNKVPAAVDPLYKVVTNRDIVCRLYHLAVASKSPQENTDHCSHATIASTPDTCASGAATLSVSVLFVAALSLITKFSS